MDIKVCTLAGEVVATETFDVESLGPVNENVLYYAVRSCRANRRQGTASTKTRGEVSGGGRKPWRQKGTGRARVGSNRSPLWRGGGVTFGPKPRSYRTALPARVRRGALREALKDKLLAGRLVILNEYQLEAPRTKVVHDFLGALSLGGRVTFFLPATARTVRLSGRNIPGVAFADSGALDLLGIISSDYLVVGRDCWPSLAERLHQPARETSAPTPAGASA